MRSPDAGFDFFPFFLSTHTVQLRPPPGLSQGSRGRCPSTALLRSPFGSRCSRPRCLLIRGPPPPRGVTGCLWLGSSAPSLTSLSPLDSETSVSQAHHQKAARVPLAFPLQQRTFQTHLEHHRGGMTSSSPAEFHKQQPFAPWHPAPHRALQAFSASVPTGGCEEAPWVHLIDLRIPRGTHSSE